MGSLLEPPEECSPADTFVLTSEAFRGLPASPMVSGRYSEPLRLRGLVTGPGEPTYPAVTASPKRTAQQGG